MKESEPTTVLGKRISQLPALDRIQGLSHPMPGLGGSRGIRSGSDRPRSRPLPTVATCTQRQLELTLGLPPCRKRNRTRELRNLAELLERVTLLIATYDTDELAEWQFFLSMLSVATTRLQRQLTRAREHLVGAEG
jgi:hypothetical protein